MIAMVIAMVTHGWNLHRKEKLKKSLFSFLEKFDSTSCSLEEEDVPFDEGIAKPLLLLAHAFEQSGNYSKTISICLYLIRHTHDDELLIYLGKVYLRAGFLHSAEVIFLEIIHRRPRRTDVLYQLELLYEMMNDFSKAREALEALEAQGQDTQLLECYLSFREIVSDKSTDAEEKSKKLETLLKKNEVLYRPVVRELFRLNSQRAWRHISEEKILSLLDTLWYLPPSQLQLDIISNNRTLRAIFFARGEVTAKEKVEECGIFAIDMLCAAKKSGYHKGDLHFSYLCTECKQSFPVSFLRCPGCMALNSLKVEENLAQEQPRRSNTIF